MNPQTKLICIMRNPLAAIVTLLVMLIGSASAQDPVPSAESLRDAFPERRHFSPYAGRNFPTEVFWGDTHQHTGMSMDAGAFGARLKPVDAYRFARGEEVTSSTGLQAKLSRPLDFLVVADHSDNMGFFPRLNSGEPSMLADPTGRRWYDMIQEGGQSGVAAAVEIIQALTGNKFPEALAALPGTDAYRSAWEETIDAAEAYNDPGIFTAFIGYEWTSTDGGYNLHRVVIYRDDETRARMMEPYTTLPPAGSPDPVDLWNWMQSYEDRTGGRLLAIAHNGNMSNGFTPVKLSQSILTRMKFSYHETAKPQNVWNSRNAAGHYELVLPIAEPAPRAYSDASARVSCRNRPRGSHPPRESELRSRRASAHSRARPKRGWGGNSS